VAEIILQDPMVVIDVAPVPGGYPGVNVDIRAKSHGVEALHREAAAVKAAALVPLDDAVARARQSHAHQVKARHLKDLAEIQGRTKAAREELSTLADQIAAALQAGRSAEASKLQAREAKVKVRLGQLEQQGLLVDGFARAAINDAAAHERDAVEDVRHRLLVDLQNQCDTDTREFVRDAGPVLARLVGMNDAILELRRGGGAVRDYGVVAEVLDGPGEAPAQVPAENADAVAAASPAGEAEGVG
jgi:hypothetical protein